MAEIVLCRIDSRLIHGQVITKWVGQSGANRIVVVSEELAKDPFMLEIYLLSAPSGVKIECFSPKDIVKEWEQNQLGEGKVLMLLPSLATFEEIYNAGVKIKNIQVGGLGGAPNRKVVFQNITLDNADVDLLERLAADDVKVIFQTIPEDVPQELHGILKKFRS